jgi:CheY-like chemotaxis protein
MMATSGMEPVNDPDALPGRILVVDDTPANVKLLEDMLVYHGFHVEAAADGESALELVRTWTPDLILLDIMLPASTATASAARCAPTPRTRCCRSSWSPRSTGARSACAAWKRAPTTSSRSR